MGVSSLCTAEPGVPKASLGLAGGGGHQDEGFHESLEHPYTTGPLLIMGGQYSRPRED